MNRNRAVITIISTILFAVFCSIFVIAYEWHRSFLIKSQANADAVWISRFYRDGLSTKEIATAVMAHSGVVINCEMWEDISGNQSGSGVARIIKYKRVIQGATLYIYADKSIRWEKAE